ncbi:hypothetical protein [Halococcus saccharolyticus]|uniref:hypothetical protein n=1 Tax=Halococcus saccharolyticus TaxID=62319 RepID=UPI0012670CF2|nr:hypothetical protein [Halococcus saccharolyticus]
MPDGSSPEGTLRINDETWALIRESQTVENIGLTQWSPPDYSHYRHHLPDDLTDSERELWENAEGVAKKYAAKQIQAWRKVERTGEYEPFVPPC